LLAVAGETHVASVERIGRGNCHRLLASRLHVETGFSLPLRAEHAFIERAGERHAAQHAPQHIGRKAWVPGADRPTVVVEHAHQTIDHVAHRGSVSSAVGTRRDTCGQHLDTDEFRFVTGSKLRLGNVQRQ